MQRQPMKYSLVLSAALALGVSLYACSPGATPTIPGGTDNGSTDNGSETTKPIDNNNSDNGTTGTNNSATDTGSNNTSNNTSSGFTIWAGSVPCADKAGMWWDNEETAFWGCGKRGDAGLFTTTDGGMTWTTQKKVGAKVNGFMRGADGKMYMAGQFGAGAAVLDETKPTLMDYEPLYVRGRNAYTSVEQGESIGVTSDGQILVDSLNGTTAAYSPGKNAAGKAWFEATCTGDDPSNFNPDATKTWCELHGVSEDKLDDPNATVSQLTEIQVVNDKFYAAGRYINDPGKVRLPSKKAGATYHMQTVFVQDLKEKGEMMDIKVWENGRIIAAGTDQSNFTPLIYLCAEGADCYESKSWERIEPDFLYDYDDSSRDGRAVDGNGDTIVVVGNFVPNGKGGWAIKSDDGGKTWMDLTPELKKLDPKSNKVDMLYNVKVFDSGKILFFGDTNYVYNP